MLHIRHNFTVVDFGYKGVCVSRATIADVERERGYVPMGMRLKPQKSLMWGGIAVCIGMMGLVSVVGAEEKDRQCIDYYKVGASGCEDVPSEGRATRGGDLPQLVSPPQTAEADEVDTFLENYGKPPREFVEFYVNPTPENARKWVAAYQELLKKSQNLSQLWSDAERLYASPETQPVAAPTRVQSAPLPAAVEAVAPTPAKPVETRAAFASIGAFSQQAPVASSGMREIQQEPLRVTYYFSQTCPFCARMTPELNEITQKYTSKLEFTCVDVTPISGDVKPDPAYLSGKLGCQWRLPSAGELVDQNIRQTPTLIIQRDGLAPVRLSGYMSQAQLLPYFQK